MKRKCISCDNYLDKKFFITENDPTGKVDICKKCNEEYTKFRTEMLSIADKIVFNKK